MERIINELRGRGVDLQVVFFDGYASHWASMPAVAACRRAFMHHLRKTNACPVCVLPGWAHGAAWDALLANVRPAYILLTLRWSSEADLPADLSLRVAHQCHASMLDLVELAGMREVGGALHAFHYPVPLAARRVRAPPAPVHAPPAWPGPRPPLDHPALASLPTLRTKLHVIALASFATGVPADVRSALLPAMAAWTVYLALHDELPLARRALRVAADQSPIDDLLRMTDLVNARIADYLTAAATDDKGDDDDGYDDDNDDDEKGKDDDKAGEKGNDDDKGGEKSDDGIGEKGNDDGKTGVDDEGEKDKDGKEGGVHALPYCPSLVDLFDGRLLYVAAEMADELSRANELVDRIAAIRAAVAALDGGDIPPAARPSDWHFAPVIARDEPRESIESVPSVGNDALRRILLADVQERLTEWEQREAAASAVDRPFTQHHYHSTRRLFSQQVKKLYQLTKYERDEPVLPRHAGSTAATEVVKIRALRTPAELAVLRRAAEERLCRTDLYASTRFFTPVNDVKEGERIVFGLRDMLLPDARPKPSDLFAAARAIVLQLLHKGHAMNEWMASLVRSVAFRLDLPDLAEIVDHMEEDRIEEARALRDRRACGPPTKAVAFQLSTFSTQLLRPVGEEDARVKFLPDAWQRRLLDAVDASASVLAVAPTSAGKTFVAYYAIESVLRCGGNPIVVYVAPTKALVKQVFDEVRARFDKEYPLRSTPLVGMFTRDERHHEDTCQVLVTVPQCLMIMLLRPDGARWVQRLRYIIHDEVHLIGAQLGDVIEQLILLADVPVVALSATLGDAERFRAWLAAVEASRGRRLEYIHHGERYNELDFSVWTGDRLCPINALWALSGSMADVPADMRVLPEYCVELAEALHARAEHSSALRAELDALCLPQSPIALTTRDAAEWSRALLGGGATTIADASGAVKAQSGVLAKLPADEAAAVITSLPSVRRTDSAMAAVDAGLAEFDREQAFLLEAVPQLIEQLQDQQMLSALVFCWQRTTCNELAKKCYYMFDGGKALVKKPLTEEELGSHDWLGDDYNPRDRLHALLLAGIAVHHGGMTAKYRFAVEALFREGRLAVVFCTTTLALGINMPCRTVVFAGEATYLNALTYRQIAGRAGRRGYDDRGRVVFCGVPSTRIRRLFCSRLPVLRINRVLSPSLVMRLCVALYGAKLDGMRSTTDNLTKSARRLLDYARTHEAEDGGVAAQRARHVSFRFCLDTLRRAQLIDGDAAPNQWGTLVAHLFYLEPANFAFLALALHDDGHLLASLSEEELRVLLCTLFCTVPARKNETALPPLADSVAHAIDDNARDVLKRAIQMWKTMLRAGVVQVGEDERMPHSGVRIAAADAALGQADGASAAMAVSGHGDVPTADARTAKASDHGDVPTAKASAAMAVSDHGDAPTDKADKAKAGKASDHGNVPTDKADKDRQSAVSGHGDAPTAAKALPLSALLAARTHSFMLRSAFVATSGHDDHFASLDEFDRSQRAGVHFDARLVPSFERPRGRLNAFMLDFWKNGNIRAVCRKHKVSFNYIREHLFTFKMTLMAVCAAFGVTVTRPEGTFDETRPSSAHKEACDNLYKIKNEFVDQWWNAQQDLRRYAGESDEEEEEEEGEEEEGEEVVEEVVE